MRQIIKIEKHRVFNTKLKIILLLLFLIYSIVMGASLLKNYNIYDVNGKKIIDARENLRKSKNKNVIFNEETMKNLVIGKDKSKYLYNRNLLILLTLDDAVKNVQSINSDMIHNFYKDRLYNLKKELKRAFDYTNKENNWIYNRAKKMKTPMRVGYREGWKNLNSDLKYTVPILLAIISLVVLQIFGEETKTKMTELYLSTRYGKKSLLKARFIAGVEIGFSIYILGMLIFSLVYFLIFGLRGFNIPIQSDYTFFYSSYNITYLQQYLIDISIGAVATLLIIGFVYLFTSLTRDLLFGLILMCFLWLCMLIVPRRFVIINHKFTNFLPYKMTDFNDFYISNEVYTIFGKVLYTPVLIVIVSVILILILFILSYVLLNKKSKIKLKRSAI